MRGRYGVRTAAFFAERVERLEDRRLMSTVSGNVFNDFNGDGLRQVGESGVANVQITLTPLVNVPAGPVSRSIGTDGTGHYAFGDVAAGRYRVSEVVPNGFTQTRPAAAYEITVGQDSAITDRNFGLHATPRPVAGSITGNLFNDTNGNGKQDAGEPYSGVRTVFLDVNRNNALDAGEPAVQSDARGHYVFDGLPPGEYHVERVLPAGYHLSNGSGGGKYVNVVLAGGQTVVDVNLGSAPNAAPPAPASINGILFEDADRDGVLDPGEARTGARTVFLDANRNGKLDAGETAVESSAGGEYHFTGLAAGTYYVTRVFPAGYRLTNNNVGYLTITVAAGQTVTGANLGSHKA